MADWVQRGIRALKAGEKQSARHLLERAVEEDPQDETAWLWLSAAVESDQEQMRCLKQVLEIKPQHPAALRGMAVLRQKTERARQPAQRKIKPLPSQSSMDPLKRPASYQDAFSAFPRRAPGELDHSVTLDQLEPRRREALETYTELVNYELSDGHSAEVVVERLVKRGFPRRAIEQLVEQVAAVMAERQRKRRRR